MFQIDSYRETRKMVIDMIKATCKWETTEGFIADGLTCPESYQKSDFKIAVLLGESYGYDECKVTDIEDKPSEILGLKDVRRKTSRKIPALVSSVLAAFEKKELLIRLPRVFAGNSENLKCLEEALKKIAWINVKKVSHHSPRKGQGVRQSYSDIYKHAQLNKEILKLQLQSIDPDLMIVCSAPVFNSLFDMNLLGENIQRGKKYKLQKNKSGKFVIEVAHPSYYRDWSYGGLYRIYHEIVTGVRPELG